MNLLMTVVLAGGLFASAGLAQTRNQDAEERYRIKYGRNTPAEEARRQRVELSKGSASEGCGEGSVTASAKKSKGARTDAAQRFQAKLGRPPAAEAAKVDTSPLLAQNCTNCQPDSCAGDR